MEYLRQTIASAELSNIFNLPQALRNRKVQVIILPAEDNDSVPTESKPRKRSLGFLKDKVPSLPDSFFEPLPEEDLQAWGL